MGDLGDRQTALAIQWAHEAADQLRTGSPPGAMDPLLDYLAQKIVEEPPPDHG